MARERLTSHEKVPVVSFPVQAGPGEARSSASRAPSVPGRRPVEARERGGAGAGLSPPPSSFHKSPQQRQQQSREVFGVGAQRGGTRHLPFPRRFLSFLFSHLDLLNLPLLPRPESAPAALSRKHWWRHRRLRAAPRLGEAKAALLSLCSQPARPVGVAVSEPPPPPGDGGRPRSRAAAGRPLSLPVAAAAPRSRERRRTESLAGCASHGQRPEPVGEEWPEAAWPASPKRRP